MGKSVVEIKKLIDIDKGSEFGIDGLITEKAVKVVTQAKALAPVDNGQLRNSIMYKLANNSTGGFNDGPGDKAVNKISGTPEKQSAYVGTATEYAVYQEYGTRRMEAQPYLRPAIDIVKNRGTAEDAKILEDAMRKAKINTVERIVKP